MERTTNKNTSSHVRRIVDGLICKWEKGLVKKTDALLLAWAEAATEQARCHSKPVSFKNGKLTVIVDNAPWLYRLTLEKHIVLNKMNEVYTGRKKIKEICFRVGRIAE